MHYLNRIQDGIGNTPILRVNNMDIPNGNRIYAKMELDNPGGSIKDRVGMYMIADAEKEACSNRDTPSWKPRRETRGSGLQWPL